jgi:tripartite-type tricarboxylate transporter receptor subunit TctC
MRMPRLQVNRRELMAAGALAALGRALPAMAQASPPVALPEGQLRIVVPYEPGGGTDILGRILAQQLGEVLHRTVIVENRQGANGTLGTAYVARAAADGLTLLIVPAGYAANPALYKSLPYNQAKDLAPVSQLASGPLVLVVHPSLPVQSVHELIALARARPGTLYAGNAGIGSLPHLSTELFNSLAHVKLTPVSYKGAGGAAADLLTGRVPVYFMNILQALPFVKEGRLRALGVTSLQATPIAPELPPVAQQLPGFDMDNWYGLVTPAGVKPDIVHGLQRAVAQALNGEATRHRLYDNGAVVVASTPEEFAAFLARETAKFNQVIDFAGIRNSI